MPNLTFIDDGNGAMKNPYGIDGTIGYAGKSAVIGPSALVPVPSPIYVREAVGSRQVGDQIISEWRMVLTGYEEGLLGYRYPDTGSNVSAKYLPVGATADSASEVVTLAALDLDLTPGFAERISRGSLRFKFGDSVFVDTAGAIYRDPGPDTGAGILSGTLDGVTGIVRLTDWVGGGANTPTLEALTTQAGSQPVDSVTFRTPVSPLKTGTLQLRWNDLEGNAYDKNAGATGEYEDNDCLIDTDFARGIVSARFGRWRAVADLTDDELASAWYDAEAIVDLDGTPSVWRPKHASAESIVYNAVAYTLLPPDSNLLGLDAARLPPDGQALIYRDGMMCLVHHTESLAKASLSANEVIDCGRVRLYRVVIEDVVGKRLLADLYTVDRELGLVTMADPLDLGGYSAPFAVLHSVADLARVRETDITGNLTLMRPVSHAYPADDSYASGLLFIGTLQARVSNKFEQTTWTGEWSDDRIGDEPLAQYNDVVYPIIVTNAGAYPDRILIRFLTATTFQVIGENLGLIATGDVNTDCLPFNPLTGEAYFTLDYQGWGGGWAAGNCLRFNLHAANHPADCVRAVQPSDPSGLEDSVELLLVGNVDA